MPMPTNNWSRLLRPRIRHRRSLGTSLGTSSCAHVPPWPISPIQTWAVQRASLSRHTGEARDHIEEVGDGHSERTARLHSITATSSFRGSGRSGVQIHRQHPACSRHRSSPAERLRQPKVVAPQDRRSTCSGCQTLGLIDVVSDALSCRATQSAWLRPRQSPKSQAIPS